LLYSDPEPFLRLERLLETQSVSTVRASSCQEARKLLAQSGTPRIVLTDTTLKDGTWRDAVRLAGEASLARAVIVVNRWDDIRLYLAALEEGALDFIAPPFLASDVSWVLRSAQLHVAQKDRSGFKAAATAG
jgi:DNA-binding NtrC family response regulator